MHLDGIHYSPYCSCDSCERQKKYIVSKPMKYELLQDCPQGYAGTIWETNNTDPERAYLSHDGYGFSMPRSELSKWFSEIKEMKKFTKQEADAIRRCRDYLKSLKEIIDLDAWLDGNTEK